MTLASLWSIFLSCSLETVKEQWIISAIDRGESWNHYGFKSVKSKIYGLEKNRLNASSQKQTDPAYDINRANLDREIIRYDREQKKIQVEAIDQDFQHTESAQRLWSLSLAEKFSFACLLFLVLEFALGQAGGLLPLKVLQGLFFISSLVSYSLPFWPKGF